MLKNVAQTVDNVLNSSVEARFLKQAAEWDQLSLEVQRQYLREHPGSQRRITAKPARPLVSAESGNVKEFFELFSKLKPNTSIWFQDGTQRPFLQSLRKHRVNVEQIEEDKTYLIWDDGGGVYSKRYAGDFTSVGYYTAPSILRTGKFVNDATRGKMVEAQVHGSTFRVTSDASFANTPSTWRTSPNQTETGFVFIDKPYYPPTICKIEDALLELKKLLAV
jgi:hypothetical protein